MALNPENRIPATAEKNEIFFNRNTNKVSYKNENGIVNSLGGIATVTDNGAGGVSVNNTNPENPVVSFTGISTNSTLTGNGTSASPLSANYQAPAVDGVTITGDGTLGNPLVANFLGYTYDIGQYVPSEGGVIFHRYLDGTTENYLVVQITNTSTGSAYSNITGTSIGTTARSSWDGLSNSNAIVAQAGHTASAADVCLNLFSEGKTDWYLPALDELILIWQNRFNINKTLSGNSSAGVIAGATELVYALYWSSTEFSSGTGWAYAFQTGVQQQATKSDSLYARAVRKFSII